MNNLMDSIVSLASIAKKYDIYIEIGYGVIYPELKLSKSYNDIDKFFRRVFELDGVILRADFEDICKRFVEECDEFAGIVRDQ